MGVVKKILLEEYNRKIIDHFLKRILKEEFIVDYKRVWWDDNDLDNNFHYFSIKPKDVSEHLMDINITFPFQLFHEGELYEFNEVLFYDKALEKVARIAKIYNLDLDQFSVDFDT